MLLRVPSKIALMAVALAIHCGARLAADVFVPVEVRREGCASAASPTATEHSAEKGGRLEITGLVTEPSGDHRVWFGSNQGLFRVAGDVLCPFGPIPRGKVDHLRLQVVKEGDRDEINLWFAVDGTHLCKLAVDGLIPDCTQVAGTDRRAQINAIEVIDDRVWVASDLGASLFSGEGSPAQLSEDSVFSIAYIAALGEVWLGGLNLVHRFEEDGSLKSELRVPVGSVPLKIVEISSSERALFLQSREEGFREAWGPLFFVDDPGAPELRLLSSSDLKLSLDEVEEAVVAGRRTLLLQPNGLFERTGSEASLVVSADGDGFGGDEIFKVLREIGPGELWVGSNLTVYRKGPGDQLEPLLYPFEPLDVGGIAVAGHNVWVWSDRGVYRFDRDLYISVRPNYQFELLRMFGLYLVGESVTFNAQYLKRNMVSPPGWAARGGRFLVSSGESLESSRRLEGGGFASLREAEYTDLPPVFRKNVVVRDAIGNQVKKSYFMVSATKSQLRYYVVLWVSFALALSAVFAVVIVSARRFGYMMALVNSPARKFAAISLFVPLVVNLLFVKRYIIGLYVRNFAASLGRGIDMSSSDLGRPDMDRLAGILVGGKGVQLVGDAGEVARYLKIASVRFAEVGRRYPFRAFSLAFGAIVSRLRRSSGSEVVRLPRKLRRVVPVLVRLDVHFEDIDRAILQRLANLGKLTDGELARRIADRVEFVVIVDASRDNGDGRRGLEKYLEDHRHGNFFLVGTPKDWPTLDGFERLEVGRV